MRTARCGGYPLATMWFNENPKLRWRHENRRAFNRGKLCVRPLHALAWAARLRRKREMKVQREEEYKQQRSRRHITADHRYSGNSWTDHRRQPSQ